MLDLSTKGLFDELYTFDESENCQNRFIASVIADFQGVGVYQAAATVAATITAPATPCQNAALDASLAAFDSRNDGSCQILYLEAIFEAKPS